MSKVLVLGGYGNFGKRISEALMKKGIAVIVAGRSREKAEDFAKTLRGLPVELAVFDAESELAAQLEMLKPKVVINTCGPFQAKDYAIARACIAAGVHYVDLADARDFVTGIALLDDEAKQKGVTVISGASTVPGLSSAVIEHYMPTFSDIHSMTFGIAPGQKAERGLATTQAILGYAGRKLKPCAGYPVRYGWLGLYRQTYPEIGNRWMANCDVPDLDIFPERYGIKKIRFSAGLENPLIHLSLWALSWLVRAGLPIDLARHAEFLLSVSNFFDRFGSADGGMHVVLEGTGPDGNPLKKTWFIIAKNGDGPHIPTIPAIVSAERLVRGTFTRRGAMACLGLVSLAEYLEELNGKRVTIFQS